MFHDPGQGRNVRKLTNGSLFEGFCQCLGEEEAAGHPHIWNISYRDLPLEVSDLIDSFKHIDPSDIKDDVHYISIFFFYDREIEV